MLSQYMFQQIRELKKENLSNAEIARRLGIDPKTVARYVKSNSPPRYKKRSKSTQVDKFGPFEEKVRGWLKRTPGLTDREVFELLIPEGFKGSERTINRRIKALRPADEGERFFEQEYDPGEQSQFDFKEKVVLPFLNGERTVHLHFATLPYSDACFVRGYPFKNYECFIDGIHSFFEELGGMTDKIRFDNLSPCVKKVLEGSKRLYTDAFKRAIAHYDFGLLPCRPAKGSDKGDVERDIRTFASRIKNRVSHDCVVFKDFGHFNEWTKRFMNDRRSEEVSAKIRHECAHLKPLPIRENGVLCQVWTMKPSTFGSVRISKSAYSVPDAWIEKKCEVVIGAYDVKIHLIGTKGQQVVHPRKPDGEHSLLLEHILPSLVRKPGAMVRWAHREILFPSPVCHKFYARLKKIEGFGAEREYLRSINLVLQAPLPEILAGMELVLESRSEKLFEDLKDLLFGERRPCDVIELTFNHGLEPIKPELSKYDSLIPKEG
jgi:transposase